ncbi:MAG: CDP-alcohol phosphatidyltransferase family protein [Candidatus Limnocylindrales bacterium]
MGQGSLLSTEQRDRFRRRVEPYAAGLARIGLTPNALTLIGFGISVVAAVLAGLEFWLACGLLATFGAAFDMLDGAVARATGRTSKFGAFLDSTFDRWGEAVVYAGIAYGCAVAGQPSAVLFTALAMGSAFMVSYSRGKAEGLGWRGEVGIAPRPERVVILGLGLVAAGLGGGPAGGPWLQLALGAIFILSSITVVQRIVYVRHQAEGPQTS